jgi:hypothetical protein
MAIPDLQPLLPNPKNCIPNQIFDQFQRKNKAEEEKSRREY